MNPNTPVSILQKKKMTNPLPLIHPPSSTTFSSLPDEIVVDCLARISKSHYSSLCLVSKRFYSLLSSPEIYEARSQIGATEPRLYVCLWLPTSPNYRWFTLSEMNSSEIYQIGGIVPSRDVHVLDCRTHKWRRGPNMTVARQFINCWYLDGKIYAVGACNLNRENKFIEVLDLKTQTWKPLPLPSGEDNYLAVAVFEGRLYVYFITSENNYAYDPKEGRWLKDNWIFKVLEIFCGFRPNWCLIDKVKFGASYDDEYKWFNAHRKRWISVCGLDDFYHDRSRYKRDGDHNRYTVRLVNYDEKLSIVWHTEDHVSREMRIWCTVISLEKRLTPLGLQIWGKVERSNFVLQVPKCHSLVSCVSASV